MLQGFLYVHDKADQRRAASDWAPLAEAFDRLLRENYTTSVTLLGVQEIAKQTDVTGLVSTVNQFKARVHKAQELAVVKMLAS